MGLSSSQARLLSLTGRMHDIEYKAQKLEAQKLQMANESTQVYKEYENALNKTKVQFKQMAADGSANFINATYNTLVEAGYKITFINNNSKATAKTINKVEQLTETDATAQGYTVIKTADDLRNISSSGKYILMNDIDLAGTNWTPISNFEGEFNGNGYVIKNLTSSTGFFENATNATIKNLGIENATINSNDGAAILIGNYAANSNITNCYVTGIVNGQNNVGGICSEATNTNITDCYVDARISGGEHVGGIVGYNTYQGPTITNCYSTGNVSGTSYVGGILGGENTSYDAKIINSYTTANVTGASYTGTIAGCLSGNYSKITDTYYTEGTGVGQIVYNSTGTPTKITTTELETKINAGELSRIYDPISTEQKNSTEWLSNMIQNGFIILSKPDSNGKYYEVNIATDTSLQEVTDEVDLKKAEAKYEADMRKINQKDKKFDTDLAAMEAERNAIKTEMETLKSVARDNVDRTYKLFS